MTYLVQQTLKIWANTDMPQMIGHHGLETKVQLIRDTCK